MSHRGRPYESLGAVVRALASGPLPLARGRRRPPRGRRPAAGPPHLPAPPGRGRCDRSSASSGRRIAGRRDRDLRRDGRVRGRPCAGAAPDCGGTVRRRRSRRRRRRQVHAGGGSGPAGGGSRGSAGGGATGRRWRRDRHGGGVVDVRRRRRTRRAPGSALTERPRRCPRWLRDSDGTRTPRRRGHRVPGGLGGRPRRPPPSGARCRWRAGRPRWRAPGCPGPAPAARSGRGHAGAAARDSRARRGPSRRTTRAAAPHR